LEDLIKNATSLSIERFEMFSSCKEFLLPKIRFLYPYRDYFYSISVKILTGVPTHTFETKEEI